MHPVVRVPSRGVAVVGDTHSRLDDWRRIIDMMKKLGLTTVIQLGDLEQRCDRLPAFRDELNGLLRDADVVCIGVGGNHDDEDVIATAVGGRYDRFAALGSHLWHAPRSLRWDFQTPNGNSITALAMGGAYSIDRLDQIKRGTYDERECITPADVARTLNPQDDDHASPGQQATVVFAHDCPIEIDLAAAHVNQRPWTRGNSPGTDANRSLLSMVVRGVRARYVFHGHYHLAYRRTMKYPGQRKLCEVYGLGANAESGSMGVLTFAGQRLWFVPVDID